MFSQRLKEVRKDRGLSQEQLAKQIGVSKSTILRWEKGQYPSFNSLVKLCAVLKMSADYLFHSE